MLFALLACAPDVPTWHGQVSPLLNEHCVRCHTDGGQGPGDWSEYDTVVETAWLLSDAIDDGRMPPPTTDPECRDFHGSDHMVLTEDEAGILAEWIDAEMPEGDPDDAPEDIEYPSEEVQDPDLVLTIPEYTPTWWDEGNPGNEYRCFVLDPGVDEEIFISEMGAVIDNRELVHHIVLFAADEDEIPEDTDEEPGFDCIDDVFIGGESVGSILSGNGMLGGWAPGALPIQFDEGVGLRLTPDQKLVLQMHYFESSELGASDASGWAFKLADEVHTQVLMAPMGAFSFKIPAEDASYTKTSGFIMPADITIHGVFPHMHVLGTSYEMTSTSNDEETCIVRGDFDFDNQLSYQFVDPIELDADSLWEMSCTWDNSSDNPNQLNDPPVDVRYGERTDEEMCFGFSLISLGH